MTTSTGSDQLGLLSDNSYLHTHATTIQSRSVGNITMPGLTKQLSQVE